MYTSFSEKWYHSTCFMSRIQKKNNGSNYCNNIKINVKYERIKMKEYKTFSTTADVGISIKGKGYEGLFQNAVRGLNLLYFDGKVGDWGKDVQISYRPFEYLGDSCENILVNFLSEIVFLLQTENKITIDINIKEANEIHIKVDLLTIPCVLKPEIDIKSVTYHNLLVKDKNGIKSAEVIFDI